MRNFYLGGNLSITNHEFVNKSLFQGGFKSYYQMLSATDFPNFPRISGIFLYSAFIFAIFAQFSKKIISSEVYPMTIILLSLVVPTVFHEIHAYNPRYTIYTLPFSIMIFYYFINQYSIKKK